MASPERQFWFAKYTAAANDGNGFRQTFRGHENCQCEWCRAEHLDRLVLRDIPRGGAHDCA